MVGNYGKRIIKLGLELYGNSREIPVDIPDTLSCYVVAGNVVKTEAHHFVMISPV